jgi:hypothetical protein
MLLVVALFAACFAWRRAVDESYQAERQRRRWDVEHRLSAEERGRTGRLRALEQLPDNSFRKQIASELPEVDARISSLREELRALEP